MRSPRRAAPVAPKKAATPAPSMAIVKVRYAQPRTPLSCPASSVMAHMIVPQIAPITAPVSTIAIREREGCAGPAGVSRLATRPAYSTGAGCHTGPMGRDARRLSTLAPGARAAAEAIYLEAFPPSERVPFEALVARDGSGAARVEAVLEDGGVVGIVSLAPLATRGWSHLEYFAVAPGRRGAGIGAAVWGTLLDRVRAERGALLLEIESPHARGLAPGEREVRLRRARFYTRLGARQLRVPAFAVPDASDPAAAPLPMLLMAAPARRAAMPAAAARALVADLYRASYGLEPDHPLPRRALASAR
jgi:GNAT superfamily N-acetyltransferase